jgi:hypothetical protein
LKRFKFIYRDEKYSWERGHLARNHAAGKMPAFPDFVGTHGGASLRENNKFIYRDEK